MTSPIVIAGQSNAMGLREHLAHEMLQLNCVQVNIIDASIGGSALIKKAADGDALCWLDPIIGPTGPVDRIKMALNGDVIRALWWVQGENDACHDVTADEYREALIMLRSRLGNPPFMVSPIAGWHESYINKRAILAAQYRAIILDGFICGPEYYDLPNDGVHLSGDGQREFCRRAAEILIRVG